MNVLIIGIGSIAKRHISALNKNINDFKIFALRSTNSNTKIPGVENIIDLNDINEKLDFIIISNPTKIHAETILKVEYLNIPIFIEKPVLSDLENSFQIARLIKNKKITTYVACNLRFHPSILFLKSYLKNTQNKINEVNIYCGSYLPDWRSGIDYKNSYSSNKDLGGGGSP